MLTKDELQKIREIRIHKILGLPDDGRKQVLSCPFHSEKTPSFFIFPDNGFKCFGCDVQGSGAIDFMRELNIPFVEALEELVKYV